MQLLLYLFAIVGLGASSILLVDYLRPLPIFCDASGGCDIVRQWAFAHGLGVATPILGVVFFVGVLLLALWPARRLLVAWAAGGAAGALAFLGIQELALGAFCKFCVVTDLSILFIFGLALATRRRHEGPAGRHQLAVGVGAVAAAFAPIVYARTLPAPPSPQTVQVGAPDVIQKEQRPGVATIVEFVDFECPFCRRLHFTIQQVLKDYDGKVRIVRKQHPLDMHPHAATAARAACCAEAAGRGEEMADALFRAPPDELTSEGCEKLAESVGVDVDRWKQCFASDEATQRLAADAEEARAAGLRQEAPVFWIGEVRYRGAQPADVIRDGIERALRGR